MNLPQCDQSDQYTVERWPAGLAPAVTAQLLPWLGYQPPPAASAPPAPQPQAASADPPRKTYRGLLLTAIAALLVGVLAYYLAEHYLFSPSPAPMTLATPATALSPAPSTAAEPQAGVVREFGGVPFVYVPAGEFQMGSDRTHDSLANPGELPMHKVTLPGFWIMRTEVTNAQYARCIVAGACTLPDNTRWNNLGHAADPITDVDWHQAGAYAQWAGGRLPTEAEWEKACRGTDGRLYPWGNTEPDTTHANFGKIVGDTTRVGSYPLGASPYGARDMAGNAWEWVADWYDPDYYTNMPGIA